MAISTADFAAIIKTPVPLFQADKWPHPDKKGGVGTGSAGSRRMNPDSDWLIIGNPASSVLTPIFFNFGPLF